MVIRRQFEYILVNNSTKKNYQHSPITVLINMGTLITKKIIKKSCPVNPSQGVVGTEKHTMGPWDKWSRSFRTKFCVAIDRVPGIPKICHGS